MTKLAVCVSILLLLITLNHASSRLACCTSYQKTRIPFKHLQNYTIQEDTGGCHLKAVVFQVKPKGTACGNPYEKWVIDAMKVITNRPR